MDAMFTRIGLMVSLVLVAILTLPSVGLAQKKEKNPAERTISGTVMTQEEVPVPGAVVQLKNLKTLQVRSFIAREKGDYIFQGLSMDVDYELKGIGNGKESALRTVSTFDPHPKVVINLKLK